MERHEQAAHNGLWNLKLNFGTGRGSPQKKKRSHRNKTATLPIFAFALPCGNSTRADSCPGQVSSRAQNPSAAFTRQSNPFQVFLPNNTCGVTSVCGTWLPRARFIGALLFHNPFSSTHLSKEWLKTLREELQFFKTTLFESWTLCAILSKKITENKKQNKIWAKQNQI